MKIPHKVSLLASFILFHVIDNLFFVPKAISHNLKPDLKEEIPICYIIYNKNILVDLTKICEKKSTIPVSNQAQNNTLNSSPQSNQNKNSDSFPDEFIPKIGNE
ncbi:MAG: hypothetical protein V7L01_33635 [Nostoc sp.]|uniref:hypothetical protein n=1 Tax=Nostoc sp. TaxID=1180 RepID=UPI002FF5E09B